MEIITKQLVEKEVVQDVICNKCGESCKDYADSEHRYWTTNYATIMMGFGYGSRLDGYEVEVHLCEDCYVAFEDTFKIKPTITE